MTTTGIDKPKIHPLASRFRRSSTELKVVSTTIMVTTCPPRNEGLVELDSPTVMIVTNVLRGGARV
eukprot:8846182-Heterocapsa_arctica.AAC.1